MKKSLIFAIFFHLIALLHGVSASDKRVVLGVLEKMEIDGRGCYTIEDSTNSYQLDKLSFADFLKRDNQLSYNAHKSSTYWKLILIENKSTKTHWVLELPDPHISFVQCYQKRNGVWSTSSASGFGIPFFQRKIKHKNFVFDLDLDFNSTDTIVLKLYSERYSGMMPNLRSFEDFSSYFLKEYHLLGMFYGVVFLIAFYNLILGFFLKESVYVFYFFYLVSGALYAYAEDGLGFQWWWGDYPKFNDFVEILAPGFLLFSFLFYSDRFLELRHQPAAVRYWIFGIGLIYVILNTFFPTYQSFILLVYLVPYVLTYIIAFQLYASGLKHIRFFLLGGTIILFSFLIFYLRVLSIVLPNVYTVYVFNYGVMVEIIFFSMSLSDKFRLTITEKEKAQSEVIGQLNENKLLLEKVNTELEIKVQNRTKELQSKTNDLLKSNEELQLLRLKLYDMNSQMDKDIWDLQKRVKENVEERIFSKIVSYEEFVNLFTEVKCYQYLLDLKWKEGFFCEKCGNTKFGRGNTNFTYKCTKCQHQESPTAKTLFHQLRFPISKAFYLTYLNLNEDKSTYEQLAALLDINKNTIWKFYQKINEKKLVVGNISQKENLWERLILQ